MATPSLLPRIEIPKSAPGIGSVILSTDSTHLIDGVRVAQQSIWADDRGYLMEVARLGQGLVASFPGESTQVSCALNSPDAIQRPDSSSTLR